MQAFDDHHRLKEDEALLLATVRSAGQVANDHFNNRTQSWTKDDGTPVSEADLAVNEHLHQRLVSARPDYGWLSEETEDTSDRLDTKRVWVVDPIDGTRSFLDGTEHWCIAVALVEDGRPLLGAVYMPPSDTMFFARKGAGALINASPLKASARSSLPGSKVIAHKNILQPQRWQRPWPALEVGMTTSLALRLCRVAEGSFDAALAVGQKCDWDLAAGDLIVHEAGGRVTDLQGNDLKYNGPVTRQRGLVACGTALHTEIIHYASGFKRD